MKKKSCKYYRLERCTCADVIEKSKSCIQNICRNENRDCDRCHDVSCVCYKNITKPYTQCKCENCKDYCFSFASLFTYSKWFRVFIMVIEIFIMIAITIGISNVIIN